MTSMVQMHVLLVSHHIVNSYLGWENYIFQSHNWFVSQGSVS